MMKKIVMSILLIAGLLVLSACAQSIEEIKNEEYVGKEVRIKGTVKNTVKIGDLSGYTLEDESGEIRVASQTLPTEGNTKTVSGIVEQLPIIKTYYINTNN